MRLRNVDLHATLTLFI